MKGLRTWWKGLPPTVRDALIRAVRTFCQALIGGIGAASVLSDVDWPVALSGAATATLISALMSLDRIGAAHSSDNERGDTT